MDMFSFSGRASRMEFWLLGIGLALVQLVILMLVGTIGGSLLASVLDPAQVEWAVTALTVVIVLAFFWPITAVAVRRSHDRNLSGWWYGLYAVLSLALSAWDQSLLVRTVPDQSPEVTAILVLGLLDLAILLLFLVILGFLPGTRGANRFGPAPNSRRANSLRSAAPGHQP